LRALEPGPADLGAAVEGLDVQVARRADRSSIHVDNERHLRSALKGIVEPAIESHGVHARVAVNLRLLFGRPTQALAVGFRDRLDEHDPSFEGLLRPQPLGGAIHAVSIASALDTGFCSVDVAVALTDSHVPLAPRFPRLGFQWLLSKRAISPRTTATSVPWTI